MKELADKLKEIKLVIFDFDGVLVNENPDKKAIIKLEELLGRITDSLHKKGIKTGIITAGNENNTLGELENAGLDFIETAAMDKVGRAEIILQNLDYSFDNLLFIGDGILDIPLLQKAGVSVAPGSARREVKRYVDLVLKDSEPELILNTIEQIFNTID